MRPVESQTTASFLVFNLRHQSSDVRQQFNGELISILQELLRVLCGTHARGCSSQDNSSCWQSCSLRQKADELGHAEDQVPIQDPLAF